MTEAASPPEQTVEQALAAMSDEERAAFQDQLVSQLLQQPPPPMVMRWEIGTLNIPGSGPAVMLEIYTPAGSIRVPIPRDGALQMASEIRKAAQTGPGLVVAQPGQVPGL